MKDNGVEGQKVQILQPRWHSGQLPCSVQRQKEKSFFPDTGGKKIQEDKHNLNTWPAGQFFKTLKTNH